MEIGTEVKNLDEINIESREHLMSLVDRDEKVEKKDQDEALSISERMMRRAQNKTFVLTFVDQTNDDEIPITFRPLYSGERREMLELVDDLSKLQEDENLDIKELNDKIDELKEFVKKATISDMDAYYESEYCQDADITEISRAIIARTVSMVEDARKFRE